MWGNGDYLLTLGELETPRTGGVCVVHTNAGRVRLGISYRKLEAQGFGAFGEEFLEKF